ncbi:septum formation family protein [Micromonospora sp. NPDC005163]
MPKSRAGGWQLGQGGTTPRRPSASADGCWPRRTPGPRARQLRPGDCVNDLEDSDNVLSLPAVSCAQPHEGEVFAAFGLSGRDWPGEGQVLEKADQGCQDRFESYAPTADFESWELFVLYPTGAVRDLVRALHRDPVGVPTPRGMSVRHGAWSHTDGSVAQCRIDDGPG